MARSAAAKKVAKAASTGAGGKGATGDRQILFPAAMVLVALLGVVLIYLARDQRSDLAPAGRPELTDHWHTAYGIYVCGEVVTQTFPDDSQDDRTGIHTHGDGLIHIHPFVSTVSGQYATLGAFFKENQTVFNDREFELPNKFVIDTDTYDCFGEEVELRVLKWNTLTAEKPVVYTENLRDIRLNQDGQLISLAVVVKGTPDSEIPRPDDVYLREYLGLSEEQKPLGELEGDVPGPVLPATEEPFETEEPTGGVDESDGSLPESSEPNDD